MLDIPKKTYIILSSIYQVIDQTIERKIQMEENERNYLSVKEFAKIAGVSTQRIYQMLDNNLQKFCKLFGKSKKINIAALQIFGKSLQVGSNCDSNNNPLVIKALLEQIEKKDKQLANKDNQIFELQNILKSMQEQQPALTKSLANSQALHAGTIKEHINSSKIDNKTKPPKKKNLLFWIFNKNQ
jgi:hypothetical protein